MAASGVAAFAASVGVSVIASDAAHASWGGYNNGYIPVSVLSPVPWDTIRILRTDARDALVALNVTFRAHFGHNITINDGYRDYAEQVRAKAKYGNKAAAPGTSNHGWAIAIDVANTNRVQIGFSQPIYLWLKANAGAFGWIHPGWAEPNGSRPEAWHWEYNGTWNGATPTPEDNAIYRTIQRNNNMASLYYTTVNGVTTFALAGDGVGNAAWLETTDQALANALAAQHGNAAYLTQGSFNQWKGWYLGQ